MRGQNCYVMSYDTMEPKRLQKVDKTMKGLGDAVHYSVFQCNLTAKCRVEMITALIKRERMRSLYDLEISSIKRDKTAIDINLRQYLRERTLWIRSPLYF